MAAGEHGILILGPIDPVPGPCDPPLLPLGEVDNNPVGSTPSNGWPPVYSKISNESTYPIGSLDGDTADRLS